MNQHYFKCTGCNRWILSVDPGPVCAECQKRTRGSGSIATAIIGMCLTVGVGCCLIVVNVSGNGDAVDTHAVVRDVIPEFVVGGTHGTGDESGRNPQESAAVEQDGESRIPVRHRSVSTVPPTDTIRGEP